MTLDDFLPYVMPRAKGCARMVATQAVRLALIELCNKAMVWRDFQTAVPTVALQTAYAYSLVAGQQVSQLLSLTLAGIDVRVVDPALGRALDGISATDPYAYGKFSGFELRPAQAIGQDIITYCTLAPSLTASTVPDDFGRYAEGVAAGALQRLFSSPELECHNPNAAADALRQWLDVIADAKSDAFKGFSRTAPRTAPSWF